MRVGFVGEWSMSGILLMKLIFGTSIIKVILLIFLKKYFLKF